MTKVKQQIKKDFVRFTRQNLYKVRPSMPEIYAKPDPLRPQSEASKRRRSEEGGE